MSEDLRRCPVRLGGCDGIHTAPYREVRGGPQLWIAWFHYQPGLRHETGETPGQARARLLESVGAFSREGSEP